MNGRPFHATTGAICQPTLRRIRRDLARPRVNTARRNLRLSVASKFCNYGTSRCACYSSRLINSLKAFDPSFCQSRSVNKKGIVREINVSSPRKQFVIVTTISTRNIIKKKSIIYSVKSAI